jgi:hypothetical protein
MSQEYYTTKNENTSGGDTPTPLSAEDFFADLAGGGNTAETVKEVSKQKSPQESAKTPVKTKSLDLENLWVSLIFVGSVLLGTAGLLCYTWNLAVDGQVASFFIQLLEIGFVAGAYYANYRAIEMKDVFTTSRSVLKAIAMTIAAMIAASALIATILTFGFGTTDNWLGTFMAYVLSGILGFFEE